MRSERDIRSALESLMTGLPLKCVWMQAGNVDYKLCDREYECDECPFDQAIRGGAPRQKEWTFSCRSSDLRPERESASRDH
jgi:hypothetical protein